MIMTQKDQSLQYFYYSTNPIPVNKLYMSEGEVPHLAVQFTFPLTVYGHFGHFDNVTNLGL